MTQSNHPIPSIIFSHLPSTGTAILVLSLPLFAQDTSTVTQSKTIVQEGNKVELVADASLDEALDRRPDLAFSNISLIDSCRIRRESRSAQIRHARSRC